MSKSLFVFVLVFIVLFGILSCSWRRFAPKKATNSHEPARIELKDSSIVRVSNDLGFKLLKAINGQGSGPDFMISPVSVGLVVFMLENGASGRTLSEIKNFLGLQVNVSQINPQVKQLVERLPGLDTDVILNIANSQWINRNLSANISPSYTQVLKKYFNAQVFVVPFDMNTVNRINNWVSRQTSGKIKNIIDRLKPDDPLVLVNAVYFKGQWYDKFEESETREREFYVSENQTVLVPMMKGVIKKVNWYYDERYSTMVAELLYGNGNFSMVFLVPDFSFGIDSLISVLDSDLWNRFVGSATELENVEVTMPKFEMRGSFDFVSLFKKLGLSIIFDKGRADFSRIGPNLYVKDIKQKTYIKVDEQGSTAAAATSVTFGLTAVYPGANEIKINKPFVFAIRQTSTNTVLFLGVIRDPSLL